MINNFCSGSSYTIPQLDKTIQDKYEQIGNPIPLSLAYARETKVSKILILKNIPVNTGVDYKDFCRDLYLRVYEL